MAFRPEDEVFAQYGLENPKYMIRYVFEDYEFVVLVSERQEGGGYYACSNLYGYNLICHVEDEKLNWLEKDSFGWISPTPFFVNITTVKRITIKAENVDVDFTLTHGTDADGNATPGRSRKQFRHCHKERGRKQLPSVLQDNAEPDEPGIRSALR